MSQSDVSKAEAADQRSEQTRSFVRRVRAATRRKYTPEEKIRIVLEGFRREVTVNDLCRGYVNRCVNDIRRRPSQPLIQWRFHPHTVHRDRRLRSTQGPSDA